MDTSFVLLTEMDEPWASMLVKALKSNDIPCASTPVNGAGVTLKTGAQERLKVYVDGEKKKEADDLLCLLFG